MTITDVKNTDIHNDESDWTGGLLKMIDTDYHEAFIKLQELFDVLGCETLMKRGKKNIHKMSMSLSLLILNYGDLYLNLNLMVPKGITGL